MNLYKIGLLCLIFGILVNVGITNAAVIECDSCESCNEAIKNAPAGSTIILTKDITCTNHGKPCILFDKKEDITFDCDGHSILSSIIAPDFEEDGIYINNSENVVIKNCEIKGFHESIERFHENIEIENSLSISIRNNKLNDCFWKCISTTNLRNSLIEGNEIRGSIQLKGESIIVKNNSISQIELSGNYHTIEKNEISGGITVRGGTSWTPVDKRGHGHLIKENELKNHGIFLVFTNNNTIERNKIINTGYEDGIWLDNVRNTAIKNNIIRDTYIGVKITESFDIIVDSNIIVSSKAEGIELIRLKNGKIINNKIGWSMGGVYYIDHTYKYGYGNGISLYWGGNKNVLIEGNEICKSGYTYVPPETEPISADILVGKAFPPNENITIKGNKCNKILLGQSSVPGDYETKKSCDIPFEGECIFPEVINEITCEPDCTYNVDNRCHSECDGINGCSFYDEITKEKCKGISKGSVISYNTSYKVSCCTGSPFYSPSVIITLSKGWNIISSPIKTPLTISKIEEFCSLEPYKGYKMWTYDPINNWTNPTEVKSDEGVYVYAKKDCTITLEGEKANFTSKELKKGWNIISIGDNSLEEVKGDCKIRGKVWELKDGDWVLHELDEVLDGSKGYWIEVEDDCTLSREIPPLPLPWPLGDFLDWLTGIFG